MNNKIDSTSPPKKECLCGKKFYIHEGATMNDPPIFVVYCNVECGEKNGWIDYTIPRW